MTDILKARDILPFAHSLCEAHALMSPTQERVPNKDAGSPTDVREAPRKNSDLF